MLFSSITFLLYFLPIVFALYYLLSFSRVLQNMLLLIASLFFYAWGEPRMVLLMIASILVNSFLGYGVNGVRSQKLKKALLWTDVAFNLGVLFFFKYLMFALDVLSVSHDFTIELPIGISFFTFQALSYGIDVYRGKVKPENPFYVGLYISFFPQLIAGPILQYSTVAEQIRNRKSSADKISLGICRFTTGLAKKVLLANCFAAMADRVFEFSAIGSDRFQVPVMLAWLGSIAYSLQIFFDFSGYSDMAIGLGLMFGFKFPENFNYPYIAQSISDFWKRWHISLTNWFREYVYFPLGGSRVENKDYMVRNLFIVWLLTGIWHGANWTFIFWGMFYFCIQLAERFFEYPQKIKSPAVRHLYTLVLVNAAWVLFRADNLYKAGIFYANMLGLNGNGFYSDLAILLIRENWVFLLAGILFCMPIARKTNEILLKFASRKTRGVFTVIYPAAMFALLVICISYLASGSYNPFIYFNF